MAPQSERHAAFLRTFMTHESAIRSYIRRLVPSRSDADDVLQETAIVLWEKFDEFQQGSNFKAWAFEIARYKVLGRLRDLGREKLVLSNDVVEALAAQSERDEERFEQQREVLDSCFAKVPERERNLLVKAYQSEAKIQEISQSSGRSVSGFYQWLHRMRQSLLACVQKELARRAPLS